MSNDKNKNVKLEGIEVSGYMPPPPIGPEVMDTFAYRLKALVGQQVTVYVMGVGPAAPVPVLPGGGPPVVTPGGPVGFTGMLHRVGADYLELHIMMVSMRVIYIPFSAIAAVVPGCPLAPLVDPGFVTTTFPESI